MKRKRLFRHESLQDRRTIRKYLKAITDGIAKGSFALADGANKARLEPDGLIRLRLEASDEGGRKELVIHLDWNERDEPESAGNGGLLISSDTKP